MSNQRPLDEHIRSPEGVQIGNSAQNVPNSQYPHGQSGVFVDETDMPNANAEDTFEQVQKRTGPAQIPPDTLRTYSEQSAQDKVCLSKQFCENTCFLFIISDNSSLSFPSVIYVFF